jgi:hypothetical protein
VPSPSCDCVLDPTRPCGCCAAPSRDLCPYPYLLGWDATDGADAADDADDAEGPSAEVEPDRTSQESEAVQVRTAGPSSLM